YTQPQTHPQPSTYTLNPDHLFFYSIPRPPPRSTLFPYTTLFRSRRLRRRPTRNGPPPRASRADQGQQEQSCRQEIENSAEALRLTSASSPPACLPCSARPLD